MGQQLINMLIFLTGKLTIQIGSCSNWALCSSKAPAQGKFVTRWLGFKDHFLFTALNISPILAPKQMSTMKKSRNFLLWLSRVFKKAFCIFLAYYKRTSWNLFKKEKVSLKSGQKLSPSQADPTKLYAGDLESTIYHMILNEIPSVEYIEGTRNQQLLLASCQSEIRTPNRTVRVWPYVYRIGPIRDLLIPRRNKTWNIQRIDQVYPATLQWTSKSDELSGTCRSIPW